MLNESRNDLNDYLYGLFYDEVTTNVYPKFPPTELTASDKENGFLVIRAGGVNDESEFSKQTYGWVRCYVDAYVPVISRGRYNRAIYKAFEDGINTIIDTEMANPSSTTYCIQGDSVLSYDNDENSNPDNRFFIFVKSFLVTIEG